MKTKTTNPIPATENDAFMWSAALCRARGHNIATTARRWSHRSA